MQGNDVGRVLVGLGAVLVIVGLIAWGGGLSWFGRLPGDIRIERETTRIYFPIVSCLVISVVLSLVAWLMRRVM
ncbi:MAG: DUF2905 domain-containing protein [Gemmatimonadota bacterium]